MNTKDKQQASEAARLMGRRGGLKGGKARAASLSSTRRSAIARLGAAKVNDALAALSPEKRSRLIMRRRTWTAYQAGRLAGRCGWSPASNPYPATAFQVPLHKAWLRGLETAGEPEIPFARWRAPGKGRKS